MKLLKKPSDINSNAGDVAFNWKDVEFIECSKQENTILHFKSSSSIGIKLSFITARNAFDKIKR